MDIVKQIKALNPDDFSEICRICLSSEDLHLIPQTLIENIEGTDLYEYTIGVKFNEKDLMPPNICEKCIITLFDMYKLKKQCLINERLFRIQIDTNHKVLKRENLNKGHIPQSPLTADTEDKIITSEESPAGLNVNEETNHIKSEVRTEAALNTKQVEETSDNIGVSENVTANATTSREEDAKKTEQVRNAKVPCPVCDKLIHNRGLPTHLTTHSARVPLKCEKCNRSFRTKITLKNHLVQHSTKYRFKCAGCNKGYRTAASLNYHAELCSQDKLDVPKEFSCKVCGQVLYRRYTLRKHLRLHVARNEACPEDIAEDLKDCPFTCSICSQLFETEHRLKAHHKHTHSGESFLCIFCGKNLSTKRVLEQHMLTHTGEKPFSCDQCDQTFTTRNTYKRHCVSHTDVRPFKCNICLKKFKLATALNKHLLLHNGEKPHKCKFCEKSFAIKGNLRKHIATHTGEKRHFCGVCNKGFYHHNMMKSHEAKHDIVMGMDTDPDSVD